MASKLLLNIHVAPFSQLSKPNGSRVTGELVTIGKGGEITNIQNDLPKGKDVGRIMQLEQNICFLQEQHSQMLAGLHKEIDNLRHTNRELQFQLVFAKGGIPSSPSSPEDDTKPKVYYSPKQINIVPLQVEILEKELGELKLQLQETDSRNSYLSAIVEEQKKKSERYERDRERELERAAQPDPDLIRKIDDAEVLIRRLRKENTELRQEHSLGCASSSSSIQGKDGNFQRTVQNRNSGGRHRGNSAGHFRMNWFPPLHTQNYWNGRKMGERNVGSEGDGTPLPCLTNNGGQYQQNKRGSNNNHYRSSEGRIYRNGGSKLL